MSRLAGKVVLITGAAGGRGVADAELMAREGAALLLTDIAAGLASLRNRARAEYRRNSN